MNILIIGCGHVGATLARDLEAAGHEISIVAKHHDALRLLHAFPFGGTSTMGDYTDAAVLVRAGIQNCDAVAVMGDDDAENLMTAQIAQKMFDKMNVICRVLQIELADIYQEKYNLKTICPTLLTAQAAFDGLGAMGDA